MAQATLHRTMTLQEARTSNNPDITVINNQAAEIMLNLPSGQALRIELSDEPQTLTVFIPKEDILDSPNFQRLLDRRIVTLIEYDAQQTVLI